MKQTLKLLFLIIYTIIIFLINTPIILGIVFLFNLVLIVLLKTNLKQMFSTICKISFFIFLTFVINIILTDLRTAILVLARLILSFSFVYSYRKIISPIQLGIAIENLFKPMKKFGINPQDISLMVNISITFVPILARELEQINTSLKAKGIQAYGINKTHKKLQYILVPWLYNTFEKTNSLELALKSKGYTE